MTRRVSWIGACLKEFESFPEEVRRRAIRGLRLAASGEKDVAAKPLKGLGPGILEISIRHKGDAYRVVYDLRSDSDVWVVHVFQKKSRRGIRTPGSEIELVRERVRRLRERL